MDFVSVGGSVVICYDYCKETDDGMKVLFIATVTEHINAFHLPYLKWFKGQGWEIHVATHGDDDVLYCDKKHNISIERSPFRLGNIKAYFELRSILKAEKFDIIHGHTPMGGMLARLCGKSYRKSGTRVIYTAHGFHFYKGASLINWLLYYPIEKLLSRYTNDLININHEDYDLAKRKMKAKRVHYVPGVGIDVEKLSITSVSQDACENSSLVASSKSSTLTLTSAKRRELNIPENATVLISVGELNKNKNHRVAIEALAQLKNDNLYYVICGSGVLQEPLQSLAEKLQIQENVLFLGQRNDIAKLLHMSDIFVFPSLREGLPVSLMEAMASGLPCIVSNIRGNTDLIKHEKGGLLCGAYTANDATSSKDISNKAASSSVTEYSEAIKLLIADESLRQSMGKHNREVIKQFDINVVMKQMQKIYLQSH